MGNTMTSRRLSSVRSFLYQGQRRKASRPHILETCMGPYCLESNERSGASPSSHTQFSGTTRVCNSSDSFSEPTSNESNPFLILPFLFTLGQRIPISERYLNKSLYSPYV